MDKNIGRYLMGLRVEDSSGLKRRFDRSFGRVTRTFGGKSIFQTKQAVVKVRDLGQDRSSFLITGKLNTSGDESSETILKRIIQNLMSSRSEQSDSRIAGHGKAPSMDIATSYTIDNTPLLDAEAALHLSEIKERAKLRKAKRLAASDKSLATDTTPVRQQKKAVRVSSKRGKTISLT